MGRWSRLLAREFLAWLNPPPGLRWIDLCCGSGVLTEALLDCASPASIAGVDASSQQIEFARRHRAAANVTYKVGNAMSIPFDDASFDFAVCGLGLNFLPDPSRALDEFRRIVRPNGTIAAYVWDYEQGARFIREFWDAAIAIDPNTAAADQARRFPICKPDELRTLFTRAGLKECTTHALDIVTRFSSFDDYWQPILAGQGSAPTYLYKLDSQIQTRIRERLRTTLPTDASGAIELPARAWAIRGQRP